jgi:minor extracellular serine protease Vpr
MPRCVGRPLPPAAQAAGTSEDKGATSAQEMCSMNRIRKTRWDGAAKLLSSLCAGVLVAACGGSADDGAGNTQAPPTAAVLTGNTARLNLPEHLRSAPATLDSRLAGRTGPVDVWVELDQPSMAAAKAQRASELGLDEGEALRAEKLAARTSSKASAAGMTDDALALSKAGAALSAMKAEMLQHREKIALQQADMMGKLQSLGAAELGRVRVAHNAVAVTVDAAQLNTLAGMAGVKRVRPVVHYQLSLAQTVPYVGGAALQQSGFDGAGVTIAVIDSGTDYTHRNLGGPGTVEAYAAAAGASVNDAKAQTRDGLFPTDKVVDGFDFVGDQWTGAAGSPPRSEDDDPIDWWFHGTNVSDIAAGASTDGKRRGMAPGAKLVSIKACSSRSPRCNGVALLKAMDFAVDRNADGDLSDAVDVINLSLGSDYGQPEDDLSFAVGNAVKLGVVVVASAGNGGNFPSVLGSPSSEPGAISVAMTKLPSAAVFPLVINAPQAIQGTYTQVSAVNWAPLDPPVTGDVVFVGRGCPAGSAAGIDVDDPYAVDPSGKIALIDRGACNASLKVDRAAKAGAVGVIIGFVAPGATFSFGFGGGTSFVPTLVITQADANLIKGQLTAGATVNVTLSQANKISLAASIEDISARGPSNGRNAIKPEIGAPGASTSADVGTGDGEVEFGGTSGASPMVAGAAAQLIQAYPRRTPMQIKAMLMNSANTEFFNDQVLQPGVLAPITRIGAGELRVDRAAQLDMVAWNPKQSSAALSYGFQSVASFGAYTETLRIENFSDQAKTVRIAANFRYDDDRANGAVRLVVPPVVSLPPRGRVNVPVLLTVDASKLPEWVQDGNDLGTAGGTFSRNEFDGYVTLQDGSKTLSVPWHIMPRKSAAVFSSGGGSTRVPVVLFNAGVQDAATEVFALTGTSPRVPRAEQPGPGDNLSLIDLRAVGVRLSEPGVVQFGISTFGRRTNALAPAQFEIDIDTNRDGTPEFTVLNSQFVFLGVPTGLGAVFIINRVTGAVSAVTLIDADFFSGNMILTVPLADIGLTDSSTFNFSVRAADIALSGLVTDSIPTMTFTPDKPKFRVEGGTTVGVAAGGSLALRSAPVSGGDAASPSQTGLLLLYRGDAGAEADTITLRR